MSKYDYYDHEKWDPIVGKMLRSVVVSPDKETLKITLEDGTVVSYVAFAGCCSTTWIEHLNNEEFAPGAIVTSVEDLGCLDEVEEDSDYIKTYEYVIKTNKGSIHVEFRNSSNGFYGGSLDFAGITPPDEP